MKEKLIRIGDAEWDIPTAADMLCHDMELIKSIDTKSENYADMLRHMLMVTVPEEKKNGAIWVFKSYTELYGIERSDGNITHFSGRVEPNISLFFESLPPEILAMREELIAFSCAAIKYIDTTTPVDTDPDRDWFAYSAEEQPLSVAFMPKAEQTRARRIDAIKRGDQDAIELLDNITPEEQVYAAEYIGAEVIETFGGSINPYALDVALQRLSPCDTYTLETEFDDLIEITPRVLSAIAQSEEDDIVVSDEHKTKNSPYEINIQHPIVAKLLIDKYHALHSERMSLVSELCSEESFRTIDVPRAKSHQLKNRFPFGSDLLFSTVPKTKSDPAVNCISDMKMLSVQTGSEPDAYANVFPTNAPAPGRLGENGVTGIEVYADYYSKHDRRHCAAMELADILSYGNAGYEYYFHLVSLFFTAAGIVEDVSFTTNLSKKKAMEIRDRMHGRTNTQFFTEFCEEDIECIQPFNFACLYTEPEKYPEYLYEFYKSKNPREYYIEYVIKPPNERGYTHVVCHCVNNALDIIETEESTRVTRHDLFEKLISKTILCSYPYVSYRIFGLPTVCANDTTHKSPIPALLKRMRKCAFTARCQAVATKHFVWSDWVEKHFVSGSAVSYPLTSKELNLFIAALYTIAVHATGICAGSKEEEEMLVEYAEQFWNACCLG